MGNSGKLPLGGTNLGGIKGLVKIIRGNIVDVVVLLNHSAGYMHDFIRVRKGKLKSRK